MKRTIRRIVLSGELLTMIFYLFMVLCGFIAGCQLWSVSDIPSVVIGNIVSAGLNYVFLFLLFPAAFCVIVFFILAMFAAGWLLLPLVVYILGCVSGVAVCSLFGAPVSVSVLSSALAVSACLFCTLVALCFIASQAHILSRKLAYSNGSKIAYTYSCGNILLVTAVISAADFIFAGIIYYTQVLFALQKE